MHIRHPSCPVSVPSLAHLTWTANAVASSTLPWCGLFHLGNGDRADHVAIGTSAPELATSVAAALRRHADVAFGNVVGSNIYNILGTGGVMARVAPTEVPREIVRFDNPVIALVTLVMFVFT